MPEVISEVCSCAGSDNCISSDGFSRWFRPGQPVVRNTACSQDSVVQILATSRPVERRAA